MVNRYGQILWLDVECRIVKRLPEDWQSPLILTYQHGGHRGFSSGVLMLDRSQLDLIDLWLKYARHYPRYPDDFVLDFLAQSIAMDFRTIPFAIYDRDAASPIARGLWGNEHTVVQHPPINRLPTISISFATERWISAFSATSITATRERTLDFSVPFHQRRARHRRPRGEFERHRVGNGRFVEPRLPDDRVTRLRGPLRPYHLAFRTGERQPIR